MQYELTTLDQLINQTLHPSAIQKTQKKQQIRKWVGLIEQQALLIRTRMIDQVINNRNSKQNESYVQTHQKGLIGLVDTTLGYIRLVNNTHQRLLHYLYKKMCIQLDSLLTFILKLLDNYFNVNLPIPEGYAILTRKELKEQWQTLQDALTHFPDLDPTLLAITLKPLQDFLEDPVTRITFQRLNYLQDLAGELDTLLNITDSSDTLNYQYLSINRELLKIDLEESAINVKVHMLLTYLNHNSPEYVNYCIAALQRKVDAKSDVPSKLSLLRLYAKILRVTRVKAGSTLLPDERRVSKQMLEWIDGEMNFIQSEAGNDDASAYLPQEGSSTSGNGKGKKVNKLNTAFDVRELALIARLFKENKRLEDHNTSIMKFMADHMTTKGSDDLSYDSVYNKWFNPRTSTVLSVRDFLHDCLKSIRKWV